MDRAALVSGAAGLFAAVERLGEAMRREGRPFALLMLVPTATYAVAPRYSVVASAPSLDRMTPYDAIGYLLDRLINEIGSTFTPEYAAIARINVMPSDHPFVAEAAFRLRDHPGWVSRAVIQGIEVEETYVITAVTPEAVARAETPLIEIRPPAKQAREPVRRRKAS